MIMNIERITPRIISAAKGSELHKRTKNNDRKIKISKKPKLFEKKALKENFIFRV